LDQLAQYQSEVAEELKNILNYWTNYTIDEVNGGFVGKIDHQNLIDPNAPKGAVLHARILWAYSAAYQQDPQESNLILANRAYEYIMAHFIDLTYGGVYWLLAANGEPIDTKKQVYAIAFTIYALSEYYLISKLEEAKTQAIELYKSLILHSFDQAQGGYFEAFTENWSPIADLRLSEKDANEKKTMNTHLHVLEAFTTLYQIWPVPQLGDHIKALIVNFKQHIISPETGHLILFFDENWQAKATTISFGHDIEAAWLLLEAAEAIKDEQLIEETKTIAVQLATVALKGIAADGSLAYEYEPLASHWVNEKHWWVQAEAMVGFFNAWQISKDEKFLTASLNAWRFIKNKIIDHVNGEWVWGINAAGALMDHEDKVGMWKCPYHNSRACLEISKRIKA
jgi:mannobiose 2-epimerase